MKTSIKIKGLLLGLFMATGTSLFVISCKKDSASSGSTVSETEAAELTTDAIVPSSGGFVVQVNSSVSVYKTVALSCGLQKDSSVTAAGASGASPAYSYSLKWTYLLSCNGIVPSQLAFNFSGTSTYNTVRMSSSDQSTGGFILTGLQANSANYIFNANYTRNGSQTSKIVNNNAFTSTLTIASANIMVDKTSLLIVSGTATVAITGSSTSGKSFSYNGSITFLGGNKATLVLNSGTSYTIQW